MASSAQVSRAALREVDCVFDAPNWLQHLDESITFQTTVVDFSRAEGEALLAASVSRKQALEAADSSETQEAAGRGFEAGSEPIFSEGGVVEYLGFFESMEGELDDSDFQEHRKHEVSFASPNRQDVAARFAKALSSPEIVDQVMGVAKKIEDAMQRLRGKEPSPEDARSLSFFVRLSSRSPKDAVGVSELTFLEEALKQRASQKTLTGRLGLFCDLSLRGMRVDTGLEAVQLLLASKRVTDDILQAVEAADQFGVPYDLSLVVRAWSPGVREDAEFRGFMSNDGQLVALSQYNEYFYQPELCQHKETIAHALAAFVHDVLRPRLLETRFLPCVLDLAILQKGGLHTPFDPHGKVCVVELNPANERTSTALFDKSEVLQWVWGETTLKEFRLAGPLESKDSRFLQQQLDVAHQRWKAFQLFRDALS